MTRLPLVLLFLLISLSVSAQDSLSITVPEVIYFADLEVTLTESVRKDVQSSVDALMRSKKYFQLQVNKVDAYFPIIERVLREEGLPDDFKYLAVQESALIPDAVSSSNAVGFWQFKKETAVEMGLRVDDTIDERMNIVSSTRAATKYLKKHNIYLENWLFALLSYYSGLGGVQSLIDKSYTGKTKMTLDGNTHWYIKKYLAHKIAFENAHGKNPNPPVTLKEYLVFEERSINQLAAELDLEEEKLKEYNKWIKNSSIPSDRKYTLIIPTEVPALIANTPEKIKEQSEATLLAEQPKFSESTKPSKNLKVKLNGIEGIVAGTSDDPTSLAQKGGISFEKLLLFNDLKAGEGIKAGEFYYLRAKKSRSSALYHTAKEGETMWSVSQKYGIKLDKLLEKNRMTAKDELQVGRVLWLKSTRPAKQDVEYRLPLAKEVLQTPDTVVLNNQIIKEEDEEITEELKADSLNSQESVVIVNESLPQADSLETSTEIEPQTEERVGAAITTDSVSFEVTEPVNFIKEEPNKIEEISVFAQHQVLAGETLFAIARKYSITVAQICAWNGIDMNQGLKVGEILKIKTGAQSAAEVENTKPINPNKQEIKLHTVAAGETLYKIAKSYGLSLKEIMDLNNKSDFTISVGEQLKVNKNE